MTSQRGPKKIRKYLVLCFVIAGLLFTAGCIGCMFLPCYESGGRPDNDIVIVKLTPAATVEWSKVIDSGMNDRASQIIQTPDNNFVIYYDAGIGESRGPPFVGLIKIANGNEIAWKIPILEKGCGNRMIIGRNGDLIAYGGQNICRINADGRVVWNRTTNFNGYIQSLLETSDSGYFVGGGKSDWYEYGYSIVYDEHGNITPQLSEQEKREKGIPITQTVVARLDTNGSVVWQTFLGEKDCKDPAWKLIDLDNNQGYVVRAGEKIIRLDKDGKYSGVIWVDDLPEFDKESPRGQNLTQNLAYPTDYVFYNSRGEAVAKQTLKNISTFAVRTNEGGYLAAGFSGRFGLLQGVMERAKDGNLHVVKLKPDGSKDWDIAVNGVLVNNVGQIIQTSDGGYALLCGNDKRWDYLSK
jgi:hypothetical protein